MPLKEDDPRVEFVVNHALISFGSERGKFVKSFCTEDNLTRRLREKRSRPSLSLTLSGLETFCDEEAQICFALNTSGKIEAGEYPLK